MPVLKSVCLNTYSSEECGLRSFFAGQAACCAEMSCALLGRRATSTPDLRTLNIGNIMSHDVGVVVLRHLASTQDSVRICRSVSKECRALVDASVRSLKASLVSLCTVKQLPIHFPRLQRLAFDCVSCDTSSLLGLLAQTKPQLLAKLTELDLSNCHGLESVALEEVLKACSSLQSLTLPPLHLYATSTQLAFVQAISTHAPQLITLSGAGDYICPASLQMLPQLPFLQQLDIQPIKRSYRLSPAELRPLAKLSNLQRLQLGNHLACYDTFALAAALPSLTSLLFSYVDEYRVDASNVAPLTHARRLQELTLCCVSCTDGLLAVLAGTPVKSLALTASIFQATPKGAAVLQQQLTELQLRANSRGIGALAAALPMLQGLESLSLAVHRCAEDCTALMQAVFGLTQLTALTLESHFSALTEQELSNLRILQQLQRLSLCNHFSDATLSCILRCTPQLQQLKLSSCGKVSDAGLSGVPATCRSIREVHLELMRGATAAGVAALAAGPLLRRVVVEGCRNVPVEACTDVVRATGKLDLEVVKLR